MDALSLLIIEDDQDLSRRLAVNARLRDYCVRTGATLAEARRHMAARVFSVALIDLALGGESGLDLIRAIKDESPDTEIVVMSATQSLASAIASYELKAFAFVPKPFDLDQLFSTVDRAVDHRRMVLSNRRLLWEQRLMNEIGDELRTLVAPEQLIERVLGRLMAGLNVEASAARLLNPNTQEYDLRVVKAPDGVRELWGGPKPLVPRPSDQVLQTKAPVLIADHQATLPPDAAARITLRSTLSVHTRSETGPSVDSRSHVTPPFSLRKIPPHVKSLA